MSRPKGSKNKPKLGVGQKVELIYPDRIDQGKGLKKGYIFTINKLVEDGVVDKYLNFLRFQQIRLVTPKKVKAPVKKKAEVTNITIYSVNESDNWVWFILIAIVGILVGKFL